MTYLAIRFIHWCEAFSASLSCTVFFVGPAEFTTEQVLEIFLGLTGNVAVELGELLPVLGLARTVEQTGEAAGFAHALLQSVQIA